MKKLFSLILVLMLSSLAMLTGCTMHFTLGDLLGSDDALYETEYSFDEEFHWFQEIDGENQKDKEAHVCDSGRCFCGYYYDCPNLVFNKTTVGGVSCYEVSGYNSDINPQYLHVKIPEYHQEPSDAEPLQVLRIGDFAFCGNGTVDVDPCSVKIKSIVIPNTVVELGRNTFCHSDIEELIIPDSVTSDLEYTAMYCSSLKRIVVGDGVTLIKNYAFCNSNLLEEVVLGSSVREIRQRNFIGNPQLKRIVLPASLVSIPESSYEGNAEGIEPQINLFKNSGNPDIFLEISEAELQALKISQKTRDASGNIIPPSTEELTTHGFVEGWCGSSKIYFVGEWYYDENGTPTPNSEN